MLRQSSTWRDSMSSRQQKSAKYFERGSSYFSFCCRQHEIVLVCAWVSTFAVVLALENDPWTCSFNSGAGAGRRPCNFFPIVLSPIDRNSPLAEST